MNLVKYIRENRAEMSDTDAHFLHEEFRGDLVALASDERELLSALMGKCSYGFFGSKVGVANEWFSYLPFRKNEIGFLQKE